MIQPIHVSIIANELFFFLFAVVFAACAIGTLSILHVTARAV